MDGQNSVPPSGSIDKFKILDVKPIRSLIPVFPMSHQAPSSAQYPSGFSPFFPFSEPQQTPPTRVTKRGSAMPTPIRSFRSPLGTGDTNSTMDDLDDPDYSGSNKRSASRAKAYTQKARICVGPIDSSALVGIGMTEREDGDRKGRR